MRATRLVTHPQYASTANAVAPCRCACFAKAARRAQATAHPTRCRPRAPRRTKAAPEPASYRPEKRQQGISHHGRGGESSATSKKPSSFRSYREASYAPHANKSYRRYCNRTPCSRSAELLTHPGYSQYIQPYEGLLKFPCSPTLEEKENACGISAYLQDYSSVPWRNRSRLPSSLRYSAASLSIS